MEEGFTKLNLQSVGIEKRNEEDVFHSEFGNFDWRQDALIRFGRSNYLVAIIIFSFLATILMWIASISILETPLIVYSGNIATSYNLLKILVVASMLYMLLLPVGFSMVYHGSKKVKTSVITTGVRLIRLYLFIIYILFFVAVAVSVVAVFMIMFTAFAIALLYIIILGLFLFFSYILITKLLRFVDNIIVSFKGHSLDETFVPLSGDIANLILISIAIRSISLLRQVLSTPVSNSMIQSSNIIPIFAMHVSNIAGFIGIALSVIVVNMFWAYDRHMSNSSRPLPKPEKRIRHYYEGYEEIN